MTDPSTIEFDVISLEACRAGAVIASAAVMLAIEGVEILTQGWLIRRLPAGHVEISAPAFRCPKTGQWAAAVEVPPELQEAIAERIAEMLRAAPW